MKDYVISGTAGEGSIRCFFATSRNTIEQLRQLHNTTPVVSAALGRLTTAAAIMGFMLKNETDLITLQVKGDGPLSGMLVTADNKVTVKGYPFFNDVDLPLNKFGKLDVGGAVGEGTLTVIKDVGLKEPYSGQVELVSGEIGEDITYYFGKSEQTASTVGLGVLVDTDYSIKASGGFIVQLMPDATEESIKKLETSLFGLPSITDMLVENMTPEDILDKLLGDQNLIINDKKELNFNCSCTRSRVEKALITLGKKELTTILTEDKKAELNCHFCNKNYEFNEDDLKTLLAKSTR